MESLAIGKQIAQNLKKRIRITKAKGIAEVKEMAEEMAEAKDMAEAKLAEITADEAVAKAEETCEERLDRLIIKAFILIRKIIRKKNMKPKSLVKQDITYEKNAKRQPIELITYEKKRLPTELN
jgi:hypothetical protein